MSVFKIKNIEKKNELNMLFNQIKEDCERIDNFDCLSNEDYPEGELDNILFKIIDRVESLESIVLNMLIYLIKNGDKD